MARDRERERRRAPKDTGRRVKKKICIFCKEHIEWVDYKDVNLLRRFMSDRGKIRARRVSGNCSQHQRDVAVAIKTARELALLPYTQRSVNERGPGGRGGRPPRDGGRGGGYQPGVPAVPDAEVGEAVGIGGEVDVDIDEDLTALDVEDAT
jgi:small subunit ribosomal protein S18